MYVKLHTVGIADYSLKNAGRDVVYANRREASAACCSIGAFPERAMSPQLQQSQASSGGEPPSSAQPKPPVCPRCERRMSVKQVTPVLFASNLDDVLYACTRCGTEAKRTVKRS